MKRLITHLSSFIDDNSAMSVGVSIGRILTVIFLMEALLIITPKIEM